MNRINSLTELIRVHSCVQKMKIKTNKHLFENQTKVIRPAPFRDFRLLQRRLLILIRGVTSLMRNLEEKDFI